MSINTVGRLVMKFCLLVVNDSQVSLALIAAVVSIQTTAYFRLCWDCIKVQLAMKSRVKKLTKTNHLRQQRKLMRIIRAKAPTTMMRLYSTH